MTFNVVCFNTSPYVCFSSKGNAQAGLNSEFCFLMHVKARQLAFFFLASSLQFPLSAVLIMGLHETDCASLTSLPCRHEDSWTLKLVNPITGKTILERAVTDESDWLQIRRDAYSRAPKEESCKIKYVVGQNVVPTGKTIKNVGLHGVDTVHVVYEHSRVEPCLCVECTSALNNLTRFSDSSLTKNRRAVVKKMQKVYGSSTAARLQPLPANTQAGGDGATVRFRREIMTRQWQVVLKK